MCTGDSRSHARKLSRSGPDTFRWRFSNHHSAARPPMALGILSLGLTASPQMSHTLTTAEQSLVSVLLRHGRGYTDPRTDLGIAQSIAIVKDDNRSALG